MNAAQKIGAAFKVGRTGLMPDGSKAHSTYPDCLSANERRAYWEGEGAAMEVYEAEASLERQKVGVKSDEDWYSEESIDDDPNF